MPQPLSGPGVGLLLPQNLYPSELSNAPYDFATNKIALPPGTQLLIPAGDWYVTLGFYCVLQYLDPITLTWSQGSTASYGTRGVHFVKSDGFNVRVANLTGCAVSGVITAPGNGSYVQASTTLTVPFGGGSTWVPIVGGALSYNSIVSAGAGYGAPPLIFFGAPPNAQSNTNGVGGIPAAGYCTIASGTISGFSFLNVGAGYSAIPPISILPNPTDPNLLAGATPTAGSLSFSLAATGSLTGVLCTNYGNTTTGGTVNGLSLTVGGVGSGASVLVMCMQCVTAVSVPTGAGAGFGTVAIGVTSVGGVPQTGSVTNPDKLGLAWLPRPLQAALTVTAAGSLAPQAGTIYDGGLFLTNTAPTAGLQLNPPAGGGSLAFETASVQLTMGSTADFVLLQPAP